jgi:hypothetical protein
MLLAASATAAPLSGHKLLITSVRTGDTEVFIADPVTGDMINVSRAPKSEDRYPCWSPDATRICFMSDREGTTNLWVSDADRKRAASQSHAGRLLHAELAEDAARRTHRVRQARRAGTDGEHPAGWLR